MNWTVEHRTAGDYVVVTTEGVFDAGDHLKMIRDVFSREYWHSGMNALFDNRKLDFGERGFEGMKAASLNHSANDALIGGGKIAILMKSISDFGLGREYEMLTDEKVSADMHVFLDEKQALRWLGV